MPLCQLAQNQNTRNLKTFSFCTMSSLLDVLLANCKLVCWMQICSNNCGLSSSCCRLVLGPHIFPVLLHSSSSIRQSSSQSELSAGQLPNLAKSRPLSAKSTSPQIGPPCKHMSQNFPTGEREKGAKTRGTHLLLHMPAKFSPYNRKALYPA